jgi:hypothetical protein
MTPLKAIPRIENQGTVCGPNATVAIRSAQLIRFRVLPISREALAVQRL